MTKRRALTGDEKADAARLLELWQKFRRDHPEATQEWLAKQCGWKTQGAAFQYLKGLVPLNLAAALKISRAINCSVSDFSPRLAKQLPTETLKISEQKPDHMSDKVFVSKISGAHLSAGTGEIFYDFEEIDRSHSFNREWMQKRGFKPERCKIWEVHGDSMGATVPAGSVVMINTGEREPMHGGIFAIITEDGLRLKRLLRRSDGAWEIHSDNPDKIRYPTETFTPGGIAILGRMRWSATEH